MKRLLTWRWLPLAAVFLLILLFFARMAFTDLILARGDTFSYFYPYWHSAGEALRAGRFPLWNDLIFTGAPLMGNSQVGLFYVPNWPLWILVPDTPAAIKASILLHLLWTGLGAYLLGRRLDLAPLAAAFGAGLFAVGGHLTAHVEQINQLQGLSWLPWLLLLLLLSRRHPLLAGPLLAGSLALQLFSGHTQTVFISLVGMGIMALWWAIWPGDGSASPLTTRLRPLFLLMMVGITALILALPQLLPTLELSEYSNRAGGLPFNEVISFSLHPAIIGRALLPGLDVALHNEYIGTIGIAGLALAVIGAFHAWRNSPRWQAIILITALGLFLAPGGWNPVYWLLGRLPGFDLFRVPARWLVLWALGGSLLAAYGVQALATQQKHPPRWLVAGIGAIIAALIAGTFLSPLTGEIYLSGMVHPSILALAEWGLTTVIVLLVLWRNMPRAAWGLAVLALLELLAASRHMPYNNLTSPDAFHATRPAIHHVQVQQADGSLPPGRVLAISQIMFGPSDQPVLRAAYADQLPEAGIYDLLIATKLKDVIAPNLNMVWGIPSADGFDGGVLPLRSYTDFSRLLLAAPPPDGRLRENLPAVPAQRWLDLMGVQYLMTDRVSDRWIADIYFDLSWSVPLAENGPLTLHPPDFSADALVLLAEGTAGDTITAIIHTADGQSAREVLTFQPAETGSSDLIARLDRDTTLPIESITLREAPAGLTLRGAALLDTTSDAYRNVVIAPGGAWQILYSGDVKLYENQQAPPRAWLVHQADVIADTDAALDALRQPEFDPTRQAILSGGEPLDAPAGDGAVAITAYSAEALSMTVSTTTDAYLLLADAAYPGWIATLDGEPITIEEADILFRAVFVPAGDHVLTMRYQPTSWPGALLVGGAGWLIMLGLLGYGIIRGRSGEPVRSNSSN